MQIDTNQNVFMVFYAIFWGAVANVQPRWKQFHWALFLKYRQVTYRVLLSVVVLNLFPLVFFCYVMWSLAKRGSAGHQEPFMFASQAVVRGVVPAFAVFGIYRLWLGIIELRPAWFYFSDLSQLKVEHRRLEPTHLINSEQQPGERSTPIVDIGPDTALHNI